MYYEYHVFFVIILIATVNKKVIIFQLLFICRIQHRISKMAAFAGGDFSSGKGIDRKNSVRNPKFGMEKGTRVLPGKIFINGRYIDQAEFLRVS